MPLHKALLPLLLTSVLIVPSQTQAAPRPTAAQRAHQAKLATLANEAFASIWMDSDMEETDIEYYVRKALDAGVSPNARDEHGDTLLLQAIENNRPLTVKTLLKRGANVNLGNTKEADSPLLRAVQSIDPWKGGAAPMPNMVKLVLQHQPQLNQRSKDGDTALLCAVSDAQSEIVALLLKAGADFHLRNKRGLTPLKIASNTAPTGSISIMGGSFPVSNPEKPKSPEEEFADQQKYFQKMARAEERRLTQGWAKCKRLLLQAGAKE